MRSRFLRWEVAVGVVLIAFLAVLQGAAWHFSSQLLHPPAHVCSPEHFVHCEGTPAELGMPYSDVAFPTADGFTISGWQVGGGRKAAVVLVHGRNTTRREGLRYAPSLQARGLGLLLIDLRNCGESSKSISSMGFFERRDVRAAVDFLVDDGAAAVGVLGFSMGAATGIMAMAEDGRIQAGVFEGGFSDFESILVDRAEDDGYPQFPLVPLIRTYFEWRGGLDTRHPTPVSAIGRIAPRPVVLVHGDADRDVRLEHGRRLYAAAGEPKELWIVPGGRHTRAWQADRASVERRIPDFFAKHLLPSPPARTR